jgi:DNA-binding transcriptional ArsR family regulator
MTRAARKPISRVRKGAHPDVPTDEQLSAAVTAFALLAEAAGCRPTIASQHLAKLRLAGLVDRTRAGRRIIYSVRGSHVRNLLTEALFHADHQVSGTPTHD